MIRLQSSSVSRRLLAWFVAATILPIAGLAWLGWAIIQQDRNAEQARVSERRDQVLGVATAALQRMLAESEERLTNAASEAGNSLPDAGVSAKEGGAALVVLDRHGLVARSGAFLPYYPATATREVPAELFAKAGHEEFGRNDPAAAAATLQSLARAPDIAVRAEALLRLARNYRKAGDTGRALAAFDALGPLGDTPAGGVAAGLAARQGRALLLQSVGRTDDLRREGSAILSDSTQDDGQ